MSGAGPCIVAVDGPAASGKTTLAQRLAAEFGLELPRHRSALSCGGAPPARAWTAFEDAGAAARTAEALGAADLTSPALRDEQVSQGASKVAAIPAVRQALLAFQRRFGEDGPGAVLAGRDIGTVVRPDAACKIFVTASTEERARRRCRELRAKGVPSIYGRVLEDLRERDARDRSRAVAPLLLAGDALLIDTTDKDIDAAFAIARAYVAGTARPSPCDPA